MSSLEANRFESAMEKAQWLAGPARGPGSPALTRFGEPARFREGLYRVGSGSYAWMVPNGSWGENNLGLIDCGGESVLVDTCWDLKLTREVLAAMTPVTSGAPIGAVINTHSDGDHCWGNQLVADKPIFATHACIRQMRHLQPRVVQALKHGGRALRRLPVGGLDRFGHYLSQMFGPYDFAGVRITEPREGFSGEKVLRVRGVEIVITEVGPGHTDGDAMVFVPRDGVVYSGDLLFVGSTPVMWSGPCERVVAGLERLLALDARVIVPGHGPLATRSDVQQVIDYWDFLQEALHRCRTSGMTPLEAARSVLGSSQFRARPFAGWDSPERIVTNAHTIYRHWGAPPRAPPGKIGVLQVLHRQASLAFDLPEAAPRVMHRF